GVGGAAVAAGCVDLGDDEAPRAAATGRRGGEWECESREQAEQKDALHGASDPGEVDGPLLQLAGSRRQCPLHTRHETGTHPPATRARHRRLDSAGWTRSSEHGKSLRRGTTVCAPISPPTSRSSTPTPTSARTSTGWSGVTRS